MQNDTARSGASLTDIPFAPNPGNLRAFAWLPDAAKDAPLVVLLHGCGQTAVGYDAGTGWSQLAAQCGFAVLAMEQKAANNPGTCFNWFTPEDTRRGEGEVASIAAAIIQTIASHGLDASRVFITGLSAGGAMTAAMLASYPELFAAGAIIAGLPFGAAQDVRGALEAMKSAPLHTPQQWGDAVRAASPATTSWPRIAIWHGALDTTVNINNAQAGAAQWADLHGLKLALAKQDLLGTAIRLRWGDTLQVVTLPAMGHGTPIDSRDLGAPAPFILDVGVSSTRYIAAFFGLVEAVQAAEPVMPQIEAWLKPNLPQIRAENLIERALKAAGLFKR